MDAEEFLNSPTPPAVMGVLLLRLEELIALVSKLETQIQYQQQQIKQLQNVWMPASPAPGTVYSHQAGQMGTAMGGVTINTFKDTNTVDVEALKRELGRLIKRT